MFYILDHLNLKTPSEVGVISIPISGGETEAQRGYVLAQGPRGG